MVYEVGYLGSGWKVTAPVGFCTDLASLPSWTQRFDWGRRLARKLARSAIVHDLLRNDHRVPKLTGDAIFSEAMRVVRVRLAWRVVAFIAVLINFNRDRIPNTRRGRMDLLQHPALWGLAGGVLYGALELVTAYSAQAPRSGVQRRAWVRLIQGALAGPIMAEGLVPTLAKLTTFLDMRTIAVLVGWFAAKDPTGFLDEMKSALISRVGGKDKE